MHQHMPVAAADQQDMSIEGVDREAQQMAEQFRGIIHRLESEARKRVSERRQTELRWLEDLRQYHGRHPSDVEQVFKNQNHSEPERKSTRSQIIINLTRPKTNAMTARLYDLLFPTDDRNWGIGPTPVPRMRTELEGKTKRVTEIGREMSQNQDLLDRAGDNMPENQRTSVLDQNIGLAREADSLDAEIKELRDVNDEARKRADLMTEEIHDQLVECSYAAQCRELIEDACKVGTGVLYGPVVGETPQRRWTKGEDGVYHLHLSGNKRPHYKRIDYWSFFPDMKSRDVHDSDGYYIRHLMPKKKLRKLAKLPGFNHDAIRNILRTDNAESAPEYLNQLRDITGDTSDIVKNQHQVWQYIGALEPDEMRILQQMTAPEGEQVAEEDVDILEEVHAVVWFCQGEILKLAIHPLDSGEPLFSVYNLEKDESGPFGFGIPFLARNEQRMISSTTRQLMDNAGISLGPQIIINKDLVEPENGRWEVTNNKLWFAKGNIPKDSQVMATFNIESRQPELESIIRLAQEFMDIVTSLPPIAQGEQGTDVTQTAQGMALLMNSSNVMFRRFVKSFDDDVTVPNLRRAYDWNMQFNEREDIKGDFEVDARGSSVLLVREMQAQNLMTMITRFSESPTFSKWTRLKEAYRAVWKAQGLSPTEYVLTDAEIEENDRVEAENAAKAQEKDPVIKIERDKIDLERAKMDLENAIAQLRAKTEQIVAKLRLEADLAKLEATGQITREQVEAKLQEAQMHIESKERQFAAEAAVTAQQGPSGGGNF